MTPNPKRGIRRKKQFFMQDIIVLIIGMAVLSYVCWRTYKTLTRKPSPADKCGGCTGCALKVDVECKTR